MFEIYSIINVLHFFTICIKGVNKHLSQCWILLSNAVISVCCVLVFNALYNNTRKLQMVFCQKMSKRTLHHLISPLATARRQLSCHRWVLQWVYFGGWLKKYVLKSCQLSSAVHCALYQQVHCLSSILICWSKRFRKWNKLVFNWRTKLYGPKAFFRRW